MVIPQINDISSYRPSIVIALGETGAASCVELMEYRQRMRAFQRSERAPEADRLGVVLIRAGESHHYQLDASNAPQFGTTFLSLGRPDLSESSSELRRGFLERTMGKAVQDIRSALSAASAHSRQVDAVAIKPVICVVGATWEPYGAALLWPMAYLIRKVVAAEVPYNLVGLFLSANYMDHPQRQHWGNALTFVTLMEGDATLNTAAQLSWHQHIDETYPNVKVTQDLLYDQVFMLDGLKSNGTTVHATDDSGETTRSMAMALEAILHTDLTDGLDAFLLDDYAVSVEQHDDLNKTRSAAEVPDANRASAPRPLVSAQTYIGVGVSSLSVPLRELYDRLRDLSAANAINRRLLAQPEHLETGLVESGQIVADALREAGERYERAARDEARVLRQQDLRTDVGLALRFDVRIERLDLLVPTAGRVIITGDDPFSAGESLTVAQVLAGIQAEVDARHQVMNLILDAIDANNVDFDQRLQTQHRDAAQRLLHGGDGGLGQTMALLQSSASRLRSNANELAQRANSISDSTEFATLRDAVEGERRWYYNQRRLRPIIESRSRLTSLLVRALLLFCVAYQFYHDGLIKEVYFFPFRFLESVANRTAAGILLPVLLAIIIAGIVIFLAVLPTIGARLALRAHRRTLVRLFELELNRELFQRFSQRLRRQADELDRRREPLAVLEAGLRERADMLTTRLRRTPPPSGDYLEYSPVPASAVVTVGQQQRVLDRALVANQGRAIASWLVPPGRDPWRLSSLDDVMAQLHQAFRQVLDDIVIQPVESYLPVGSHVEWSYRLWRSCVPWIRTDGSQPAGEPEALLSAVVAWPSENSTLTQTARGQVTHCQSVASSDPFRVLFMQLLAGVRSATWARRSQCEQAFREQSASNRTRLTDEAFVFEPFVCIESQADVPGPSASGIEMPAFAEGEAVAFQPTVDRLRSVLHNLESCIRPLRNSGDLDQAYETAVLDAIRQLEVQVVNIAGAIEDRRLLARLLVALEMNLAALPAHVQPLMATSCRLLNYFVEEYGFERVSPSPGDIYQPALHGANIEPQHTASMPPGQIVAILQIGYRERSTGSLVAEPHLVVSAALANAAPPGPASASAPPTIDHHEEARSEHDTASNPTGGGAP